MSNQIKIFQTTKTPENHKEFKLNKKINWHTWSSDMSDFLSVWSREVKKTNRIRRIYMTNRNMTQDSYTLKPHFIKIELRHQLYDIANSFYLLKHNSQPIFFTNMINDDITFNGLHSFFASLREILIRKLNDQWRAIYTPIYTLQKHNEDTFPLHYDMFIPKMLFMIYNDVPKGKGGTTTFLSTKELQRILLDTKSFSIKNRKLFRQMLISTTRHNDQYDIFWDLIYNKHNEWYEEIQDKIKSQQYFTKFNTGEGFIVHDRLWLHGRTKIKTKIGIKRVIRLVFDTEKTIQN